ncbi:MAG TPA: hypothetical protein VGE52_09785, partial [Pirellulales bacterium]
LKLAAPRLSFLPCLCAMLWVTSLAYLKPGLGKLAYGWEWIASNDLANLHQAAVFQNGWTTDLSPWLREWLDSSMLYLNTPLKIGTLILEVGILLIVARRSLAVLFLVGCSSMHLGIFIFSGIYFWKWIAMDLLLAGVLAALPAEKVKELFRPQLAAFGLAAIAVLLGLYKRPPTLAWLDSPLARRWHIEAVGESGARYQIPPSALAPYDLTIAQARLDFLSDRTYFVGCFGCIKDVKLCRAVSAAQSAAEVEKIREAIPTRKHEPESYRRFERLLKQYVQRGPSIADYGAFAYLKAPQHIWSRPIPGGAPAYEFQEPIARIEIFAQEAWRRPDGMQPIHQDLAFRLNFSEPAAMAAAPDAPIFK